MNQNAKILGMKFSQFANPHGLPNLRNTSNPLDLTILISACLKIDLFKEIVKTKVFNVWITNSGLKK
jgi:D-alanyl-D-alanine carboxypeptidase